MAETLNSGIALGLKLLIKRLAFSEASVARKKDMLWQYSYRYSRKNLATSYRSSPDSPPAPESTPFSKIATILL